MGLINYTVAVTTYMGNVFHYRKRARSSHHALAALKPQDLPGAWQQIEVRFALDFRNHPTPPPLLLLTRPTDAKVRELVAAV